MRYFFERNADQIQCELRAVRRSSDFEIVIAEPGRAESVETYADLHAAAMRWRALTRHFYDNGWHVRWAASSRDGWRE